MDGGAGALCTNIPVVISCPKLGLLPCLPGGATTSVNPEMCLFKNDRFSVFLLKCTRVNSKWHCCDQCSV